MNFSQIFGFFRARKHKSISILCTFLQNNSYPVLKSKVIRVETVGYEIKNLSNQLVINFPVNSSEIKPVSVSLYIFFRSQFCHSQDPANSEHNRLKCTFTCYSRNHIHVKNSERVLLLFFLLCPCGYFHRETITFHASSIMKQVCRILSSTVKCYLLFVIGVPQSKQSALNFLFHINK